MKQQIVIMAGTIEKVWKVVCEDDGTSQQKFNLNALLL